MSSHERNLPMSSHELKTWSGYYNLVVSGAKTFEVRRDDRGFKIGDILRLKEYMPSETKYTGRHTDVEVTYILTGGQFGIERGYVVMGFRILHIYDVNNKSADSKYSLGDGRDKNSSLQKSCDICIKYDFPGACTGCQEFSNYLYKYEKTDPSKLKSCLECTEYEIKDYTLSICEKCKNWSNYQPKTKENT